MVDGGGFRTELFRIPLVIERSTYGFSAVVVLSRRFSPDWWCGGVSIILTLSRF